MRTPDRLPRIVFIQLHALGLLDPQARVPFGGAETRAVTFAGMLQASGRFDLAFAVLNPGGASLRENRMRGMDVAEYPFHDFTAVPPDRDMSEFYASLGADCLVSLGANEVSWEMVRCASRLGVPSVVGLASDQSLRKTVFNGSMIMDEYRTPGFFVWEAMRQAGTVLVQTAWQQEELYRRAGQKGVLVHNPVPRGWEGPFPARPSSFAHDFLWVGRPAPDKNPEIVFEAAREMPEARFRMVVDGGLKDIRQPWASMVPPNVELTDRVQDLEGMKALVGASRAIINTSPLEGFPNVMLQGAMAGCPTIFLSVDPDGWCSRHGCAASAAGDFDAFLGLLARARADAPWLEAMASRARARASALHAPEAVARELVDALDMALAGRVEGGH